MNITTDSGMLMSLFILPSLFGLSLIGEGVSKIMNYDNHGWLNVCIGSLFVIVIIIAYFLVSTNTLS